MSGMEAKPHSVKYVIVDAMESEARLVFECSGDKDSACHNYPDCGCEGWSEGHEHPSVPHRLCWLQDWFDECGASYAGSDGDLAKSGPIDAWFDGDAVVWEYMEATS